MKSYSLTWRKPRLTPPGLPQEPMDVPEPTGAQIEALFQLERAREEGVAKGLVVAIDCWLNTRILKEVRKNPSNVITVNGK